jgi:hypothetical protein
MRAFYYFQLINLYAKPYNAPGIDRATEPGLPLILTSQVTDRLPMRATMAQVYDRIESDLLTAMPLMDAHGKNQLTIYRVSDLFVHTLLSRMYLYMENWEKAEEHASIVLARKPTLLNLASIPMPTISATTYGKPGSMGSVFSPTEPEIIWGYSFEGEFRFNFYFNNTITRGDASPFMASQSLKECYEYDLFSETDRKDLRPTFYYQKYPIPNTPPEIPNNFDLQHGNQKYADANGPSKGMRTAELYINRAEANAQMFIATGDDALRTAALSDLNTLRENRYDTRNVAYVPVEIADGEELLQFCRDERRRELCYEEHRWFDLRRYGMPEISHVFRNDVNAAPEVYTLRQGDERYVLTLPSWVRERNPNL